MDDRLASLLDFGAELGARHDHPRTPIQFARATGIRLIPGDEESANAGPPAIVTYNARFGTGFRRFSLWHEIAHVLMGWHGIDQDFDHWLGEGDGERAREQAANLLASLLMVPRPVVRAALKRHGATPAAIQYMQHKTGMSEAVCVRRFTHDELSADRAAVVFVGGQVVDVSTYNYRVPFRRWDRVIEPALIVEGASMQQIGKARVMAVWEG